MLTLHRASRGDRLAAGLARLLAVPAGDPFDREVVAVPTRGVERWLSQQLASVIGARPGHADGVCANVEFPFPGALVGAALGAAGGVDPDEDPWQPERSVWPLLSVVEASLGEGWLAPLAAHLGPPGEPGDDRAGRRFAAVRHLADLFDRYAVHRPGLVRGWAEGASPPPGSDGEWQAELWRRLRAAIGTPSPAERLPAACEALIEDPSLVDLPGRLSAFGLTRLPASYLDVLAALGAGREVHLWLLHPSPVLWERVAAAGAGPGPRRADPTSALPLNPLLRSWGRDSREMQAVLCAGGAGVEPALPDPEAPATLLGRIQAGIREDAETRAGPGSPPLPLLDPADRSLQVHSCHGRARQVEVLRDAIVGLLARDPTLEPRDVIVMCPDIEEYAPLVHAVFGPGDDTGSGLHVRLADRSLRQTNPVLSALSQLLELAAGRVTASGLLDLAGTPPLRCRFGFDDDELARMDGWARAAGVRWGVDEHWRRPYRLSTVRDGTWAAGLDRLLAGVAMSEDPFALVGAALPLDDVDSGDIDLAGRVAEMVARAGAALGAFSTPHTLAGWVEAIGAAADSLLGVPAGEEWQAAQLDRLLFEVAASGGERGAGAVLSPAEVRALLADRLRGVPTRANFRTGHLTVCTLVPMRSVPHRVVCLLGLDDGAFPRRTEPDCDDLLARDPRVGERDPRSEDRQLLLDAVLAATDTLVVTYAGRDERTNARRPPAVPVGELLDAAEQSVRVEEGTVRDRVVVEHPLQPFDERNFITGGLVPGTPWSFDRSALAGAVATRQPRPPAPSGRIAGTVLPPVLPDPIALGDLVAFAEHPVKAFLRQRLGVSPRSDPEQAGDAIPLELDGLERWRIGDRLLTARLAGVPALECMMAETGRGFLPPGRLGRSVIAGLMPGVEALVDAAAAPTPQPDTIDVAVACGAVGVAGSVPQVFGTEIRAVFYSRLAPHHRLAAWVRLVALSAARPDRPWRARTVGRASRGDGVAVSVLGPLGSSPGEREEEARRSIEVLVDLYLRGMCEALPLAAKTSAAWAKARREGKDPGPLARRQWVTAFDAKVPGEDSDPCHRLVHGGRLPWEGFLEATPAEGETGPGWPVEATRAGCLAVRLWERLLDAEMITGLVG